MVGDASELALGVTTLLFFLLKSWFLILRTGVVKVVEHDHTVPKSTVVCRTFVCRNGDQSWDICLFAVLLALVDQYIGKPVCWAVRSESSLRQLLS